MPERSIIQSSGFANTEAGFTLRLRQPNYRGLRLSLIEGIDITVDGQTYPAEANSILLRGEVYSHAAMAEATETWWNVGETIAVQVAKPDGLSAGVHEVGCTLRLRHPYFPPQFQPAFVRETRHITIIQP
ncbi:DUF6379 domain-containing protein [Novosphingobium sp. SG707]|uniref:C-glycoside deglycosidase beta subunit domain-containing protein n=1 Tax=Novosphingobium sp. SG707 TaxID=2586996 RepID=UPI001447ED70|nr:DUF6379 domain-containing protein [Novosphingobium sp. SG707]NKI98506.1 hypothetical protein [Novosphingobium sp. SG707]